MLARRSLFGIFLPTVMQMLPVALVDLHDKFVALYRLLAFAQPGAQQGQVTPFIGGQFCQARWDTVEYDVDQFHAQTVEFGVELEFGGLHLLLVGSVSLCLGGEHLAFFFQTQTLPCLSQDLLADLAAIGEIFIGQFFGSLAQRRFEPEDLIHVAHSCTSNAVLPRMLCTRSSTRE